MCICWLAAHIHCLMKSKRTKHTTTPTTTLEHKKNLSKFSIVIHRESSCLDFLDDFCVLDRQVNMLLLISSQLLHIGCNKLSHSMKKKNKKNCQPTPFQWLHIFCEPNNNTIIYFHLNRKRFVVILIWALCRSSAVFFCSFSHSEMIWYSIFIHQYGDRGRQKEIERKSLCEFQICISK